MVILTSFWKTILWICVILFLSLSSGDNLPHPRWLMFLHIDKVVHFVMYFVFALALIHDSQNNDQTRLQRGQISLLSVLIVTSCGGIIEILQAIPAIHRNCDFFDFLANAAGAVLAAALYRIFEPLLDKINHIVLNS